MRLITLILAVCLLNSCKKVYTNQDNSTLLKLKWNKSYEDDSIDKAVIGLQWALSYVGANTPCNSNAIHIKNNTITLNTLNIGFSNKAKQNLKTLIAKTKTTEAYKKNESVDLGRFITLLLGSPEHYYSLVETPKTLAKLKSNYTLNKNKGYINNSSIAFQDRVISFSEQEQFNQLWISEEIDSITKTIYEFETIELLKNGQLRFGIYDEKGNRKNFANSRHTGAGKPSKCIWCHESNLNQMFKKQSDVYGFLTAEQLQQKIITSRDNFHNNRLQQKNNLDYSKKQQHKLAELLYISFLEPSLKRLSLEWHIEESQLKLLLKDLKTHKFNDDFQFLGDLYYRQEVEVFSPFKAIPVSGSVREQSAQEINHLNNDK
ncbi:hypothetical protein [Olleya sp. Bg11-27]|uniref:hypothetical protein n=1 Tax=Olleya sp. Bg11-27 TaxID=2058135 RepID=UPI000C30A0A7|nr:hypothetical protein [Olleya sp. Bg11-27]AUC77155.1 hypothetical protein CW732_16320 [Olleya sp. Bg11-27]